VGGVVPESVVGGSGDLLLALAVLKRDLDEVVVGGGADDAVDAVLLRGVSVWFCVGDRSPMWSFAMGFVLPSARSTLVSPGNEDSAGFANFPPPSAASFPAPFAAFLPPLSAVSFARALPVSLAAGLTALEPSSAPLVRILATLAPPLISGLLISFGTFPTGMIPITAKPRDSPASAQRHSAAHQIPVAVSAIDPATGM
jgi:hypothetical protein